MLQRIDNSNQTPRPQRQTMLLLLLLLTAILLAFHTGMSLLLFDPSVTRYRPADCGAVGATLQSSSEG